jgi:hypothetical protein
MNDGLNSHTVRGEQRFHPSRTFSADRCADALSAVPLDFLRAELARRQDGETKPACGTTGKVGSYNTATHVFALVLILVLSTVGKEICTTWN